MKCPNCKSKNVKPEITYHFSRGLGKETGKQICQRCGCKFIPKK